MTKIDIFSGFLGAGKTTLIKKLIAEGYQGQKLALIENDFGEIGIDGDFLQDAGIEITEVNSGCICCSLVGDFGKALQQVVDRFHPDRILIEPSGVGKLSDVIGAVNKVSGVTLGYTVAVADAGKVKVYMKNFGEFYNNQIETASTIILSRTDAIPQEKLDAAVELLRQHNQVATVVTTPWTQLTGQQIMEAMEGKASLAAELAALEQEHLQEEEHHHHHHDDDEEDGHHCCHHHHDDEEEDGHHCCHHHHDDDEEDGHHCCHHHHDDEEEDGHHCCHHHHDDDEEDGHHCCHHHHDEDEDEDGHHHHHHHHADEVFTSWGVETARKFAAQDLHTALDALDSGKFGTVLRAKGIVPCADGSWLHFDYVPGEANVRTGGAAITGKLCVIGAKLDEDGLKRLFGV